MLVATPGQAAPYPLHNNGPKKKCHTTAANQSNANNACKSDVNSNKKLQEPTSSTSAATAIIKTFAVRLNRSTEFLKGTLQRALASSSSSNSNSNYKGSAISASNNIKNNKPAATSPYSSRVCPSSTILKLYTVPPTAYHRFSKDRMQTDSVDSLQNEMCHFKPIRLAPTTPWKCNSKSRGPSLKIPKASVPNKHIHTKCDHLPMDDTNDQDNKNIVNCCGKFAPKPSSFLPSAIAANPSAFVCLHAQMIEHQKASLSKPALRDKQKKKEKRSRQKPFGYKKKKRGNKSTNNCRTNAKSTGDDEEQLPVSSASSLKSDSRVLRSCKTVNNSNVSTTNTNQSKHLECNTKSTLKATSKRKLSSESVASNEQSSGTAAKHRKVRQKKTTANLVNIDYTPPVTRSRRKITNEQLF